MKKSPLILILTAILLSACGSTQGGSEFNIIAATDLHYISPEIHDDGEYFTRLINTGDGKLTMYSEELTDAFLHEVISAKPDALILTGDLTFNGALESHEALADKLREVEKAGIPVLVTTGNHDMYNSNAAAFSGSEFRRIRSADEESFARIYAEFGLDEAVSRDSDSLSYVYRLNDSTVIIMFDFNTPNKPCGISENTLSWAERELKAAKKAGDRIIAAGHQNLYAHSIFDYGYVIDGHAELAALLKKYGAELFLSGHLHTQHIITADKVTEIVTSALSVSPCHYAVLSCDGRELCYETRETDVSAWAAAQEYSDERLLNFSDFAEEYFGGRNDSNYPDADDEMMEFLRNVNAAYFSGHLENAAAFDPDGSIIARWDAAEPMLGYYLRSMIPEYGQNYNVWSSEKIS